MQKLVITTPCTRPENLPEIGRSVFSGPGTRFFDIEWNIVFDARALREIPVRVLERYAEDPRVFLAFNRSQPEDQFTGYRHINKVLGGKRGEDFWHYVLDDDNLLHSELLPRIHSEIQRRPDARAFVFSQWVGGNDFTGLDVREAKPENVAVSRIDQAQFFLHSSLIGDRMYATERRADGKFIVGVYSAFPSLFVFLPEVLCYYNKLRDSGPAAAPPRVLVFGRGEAPLRSIARADWESEHLTVRCVPTDADAQTEIASFAPDAVVTYGATPEKFPSLYALPFDLRRRWIDVPAETAPEDAGERAYNSAMGYILNRNEDEGYTEPLVSIFTPLRDTGPKLWRAYRSLTPQTHTNWEWVLVDDSPSSGATLAVAEEIAARDPRVRVYDVRPKSGGVVGEAKHRAAALCRGSYLLELDHDDELTPWAVELMIESFRQFPEAGFSYSDCVILDERMQSLTYGQTFAFGYGTYYEDTYGNATFQVARQPAVNPKTVRHIVGAPNHFRAWRRNVYLSLGGHNRRLSIADDYELVLRTFLTTRMVHVPRLCYLQHFSRSGPAKNTQLTVLGDIQRRVRSISWHYEDRIRCRFAELGLVDWAAEESPSNPLAARSRFGRQEQPASLTMDLPS